MVTSLHSSCLLHRWTHPFCAHVQVPCRDPCRCTHIWCVYPCMKVCLSLIFSLLYSSIVCPSFLLCFRLLGIDSLCLCLLVFGPSDRLTFFASDNVSAFGTLVFVMVLGYLNSVHRLTTFFTLHLTFPPVRFFVLSVFLYISTLSSYPIKSVHGCTCLFPVCHLPKLPIATHCLHFAIFWFILDLSVDIWLTGLPVPFIQIGSLKSNLIRIGTRAISQTP